MLDNTKDTVILWVTDFPLNVTRHHITNVPFKVKQAIYAVYIHILTQSQ